MKKIILILTTLCMTFAYSFAQSSTGLSMSDMIDRMDQSAVKRATAGEFSTDSDKFNAKDVFDLNRTVFSAGYVPGLNSSGNSTIQAFFGIPIMNNAMYFGIAGFYDMNETRNDYINGNTTALNKLTLPTDVQYLGLGSHVKTASAFAIRPVLKINDMVALHFLIARGGDRTSIQGYTSINPYDTKNYSAVTNLTDASQWVYEVAAGLKFGDIKVKIPVTLTVNGDGTGNFENKYSITKAYNEAGNVSDETVTASSNRVGTANNYPINLTVSPEVSIPLQAGPMTTMTVGLSLGGDVYGADRKNYTINKSTHKDGTDSKNDYTSENVTEVSQEGVLNMNFDVKGYPTLEWSLAEEKVRLVMEPTIGLEVEANNVGKQTTKTTAKLTGTPDTESTTVSTGKNSNIRTTPYIEMPVGTTFRPVQWFEFRAGLKYRLGFDMYNYSEETLGGAKSKQFNYNFTSEMNLYTGMGFIVGEDFFIDLFLVAGSTFDKSGVTSGKSLLNIDSWGAQLSYRL